MKRWMMLSAVLGGCGPTALDVVDRPPNPTANDGLVAHWNFDEIDGTIAHDDSGNGYHGHLVGGQWVPGHFGGAISLARGDFVGVNAFESPVDAWSVSVWVSLTVDEVAGPWGAIASTELPQQGGWLVYLEGYPPPIPGRLFFEYVPSSLQTTSIGCCDDLTPDTWYHLTFVASRTAGSMTIYLGSTSVGTAPFTAIAPGDSTLYIGKWRLADLEPQLGGFFGGTIDDLAIFDRALGDGEVAALDAAAWGR